MIVKQNKKFLDLAKNTLQIESTGIDQLRLRLDQEIHGQAFLSAIELILPCAGRVVVSGMGKSGHIANKIAATFASTGTPAFFVHPAEANHGDLGMIQQTDIFLALSYSGETLEY